jgi:hypothetical protein
MFASRRRVARFALGAIALSFACRPQPPSGAQPTPSQQPTEQSQGGPPRTRAEATNYRETSLYVDVVRFLDSLAQLKVPLFLGNIGKSPSGQLIPVVIASRPVVRNPYDARQLNRPVVYVQGNIHAGEVEGKEALLALIRDLAMDPKPNVLDSVVLIAVPIYNVDGNDSLGPQARNRSEQNGPEMVGRRSNGQGLDLNRDYVKAEAPETRASLAMFKLWSPDVFVDLHTTDGSYHGYALTYAPSLSPSAIYGGVYARDSMLPILRQRMRDRHNFETFDYGNFPNEGPTPSAWETYDSRPRFGTNYYGLRGGIAILSEAFSHDPFERRVASTRAFIQEILSLAAEQTSSIAALRKATYARTALTDSTKKKRPVISLRSELTYQPDTMEVLVEDIEKTGDSSLTQAGVAKGWRRTGRVHPVRMPVFTRFQSTLDQTLPIAYALPAEHSELLRMLSLHGIIYRKLSRDSTVSREQFKIDSVRRANQPFQKHRTVSLIGQWSKRGRHRLPANTYVIVDLDQPLGALAGFLLEPESEDGFVTWNFFDEFLERGATFPVLRIF